MTILLKTHVYKPVPCPSAMSLYSSFVTVLLQVHMLSGLMSTRLRSVPTECASRWVSVGGGAGSAFSDGTGIEGRPQEEALLNCPVGSMPVTGAE